jgi:hypothetical protein
MRIRIAVVLLAVAAAAGAVGLRAPHDSGPTSSGWHEARPVYGAVGSGFFVRIADLRSLGALTDGSRLLAMQVGFHNAGGSTYSARPGDFQLIDDNGETHLADTPAPPCIPWAETPVAPGAVFGPVPLCFRSAVGQAAPTTLVWQPDVAFTFLATANRISLPPI